MPVARGFSTGLIKPPQPGPGVHSEPACMSLHVKCECITKCDFLHC